MQITSKGQVTIPIQIRERAGLLPGTEVEFVFDGRKVIVRKKRGVRSRGQDLVRRMSGKGTVRMTTDEIMSLTRGE